MVSFTPFFGGQVIGFTGVISVIVGRSPLPVLIDGYGVIIGDVGTAVLRT